MSGTPTLREWQNDGLDAVMRAWTTDPNSRPLIAACPGSGKTLFAVTAAREALKDLGVEVTIVVGPSINIKGQWTEDLNEQSISANEKANNEALRLRRTLKQHRTGGWDAICITYSQLSKDAPLFAGIAHNHPTLVIADEVHHADDNEAYGKALAELAEGAKYTLALSGTPFNTTGGALAMCDWEAAVSDEGRSIMRTIPLVSYSYGDAILESVCRPTDFYKVLGKNHTTYRSIVSHEFFTKVVDLARKNKTDSIGMLLDPEGEFMEEMISQGLSNLADIRRHDSRAGMLLVAKDTDHGARLCKLIERVKMSNPDWCHFNLQEIYNDTEKAHTRIKALKNDNTDIVVTVRMISEGVNVPRFRVGVYATDYLTRMFFVQFVGRFIRWEDRLDGTQHCRIIIPAHIQLLTYAREIEQMMEEALISDGEGGEGPGERKAEVVSNESEADDVGIMSRGEDFDDLGLSKMFFEKFSTLRGKVSEADAIKAARQAGMGGSAPVKANDTETDWGRRNDQMVRAVVKILEANGETDDYLFAKVQKRANNAVGIVKKDALTQPETLKKRHAYLKSWLMAIRAGQDFDE